MGRLSHLFGIVRRTQLHPGIWLWRSRILDVDWQSHTDRGPHLIHLHRHGGWKSQTRRLWLSILEESGSFHHQVSRRRSRSISRISLLFVSSRFCGCGTRVCLHDCWRGEKSTMCKLNEKRSCLGTMLSTGHFLWFLFSGLQAENPRAVLPKAYRSIFWRLTIFFVLGSLSVGINVPYNDPKLIEAYSNGKAGAAASPFVRSMEILGIPILPHIVNALILTSAFSAGNRYV